ncbi:MAG: signal peptidase II [Spirochaetia bacterium]|jgi:signal peptidase II|nr:signal peptidase II [Spirochaetia bacterium]
MITQDKLKPLILTGVILIIDQVSKLIIVNTIPIHTIGKSFFGGILRIIHTRNLAIAFSIGKNLPDGVRYILFTILPIAILIGLFIYFLKSEDFTYLQRWAVAGILGGGIGNLIDRVLRPLGVVDFVDVKFYGIFGLERWPTFNVADSTVVVAGLLLLFSFIFEDLKKHE